MGRCVLQVQGIQCESGAGIRARSGAGRHDALLPVIGYAPGCTAEAVFQ